MIIQRRFTIYIASFSNPKGKVELRYRNVAAGPSSVPSELACSQSAVEIESDRYLDGHRFDVSISRC